VRFTPARPHRRLYAVGPGLVPTVQGYGAAETHPLDLDNRLRHEGRAERRVDSSAGWR